MAWTDFLKKWGKPSPTEVSYEDARDGIVAKGVKMELALDTMKEYNEKNFGGAYPENGYDPVSFAAFTNWYETWQSEHDGNAPTRDDMWSAYTSEGGITGMKEFSDHYLKVYEIYQQEADKVDAYVAGRANGSPEPQEGDDLKVIADRFAEMGEKVDEVALNVRTMGPSHGSIGFSEMFGAERWALALGAFDQYAKNNNVSITGMYGDLDDQQKKELGDMIKDQIAAERDAAQPDNGGRKKEPGVPTPNPGFIEIPDPETGGEKRVPGKIDYVINDVTGEALKVRFMREQAEKSGLNLETFTKFVEVTEKYDAILRENPVERNIGSSAARDAIEQMKQEELRSLFAAGNGDPNREPHYPDDIDGIMDKYTSAASAYGGQAGLVDRFVAGKNGWVQTMEYVDYGAIPYMFEESQKQVIELAYGMDHMTPDGGDGFGERMGANDRWADEYKGFMKYCKDHDVEIACTAYPLDERQKQVLDSYLGDEPTFEEGASYGQYMYFHPKSPDEIRAAADEARASAMGYGQHAPASGGPEAEATDAAIGGSWVDRLRNLSGTKPSYADSMLSKAQKLDRDALLKAELGDSASERQSSEVSFGPEAMDH